MCRARCRSLPLGWLGYLLMITLVMITVEANELRGQPKPHLAERNHDRLNVVLILIDDLGWTDWSLMYSYLDHSHRFYETPNIDRLADQGMMFTDAYANGPNCAPSRACLMTGKYSPRHGIYTVGDPRRGNHRFRKLEPIENQTTLDDAFVTLAEVLQQAGYATASMGKWHLGKDPCSQGFDLNIAGREWGSPSGGGYFSPLRYPQLTINEPGVYLTDAITNKAVEFIRQQQNEPFFLYLTHYAVHTPIQAKPALIEKYAAKDPTPQHDNPTYAAMIQSMDESVGRVLDVLDELNLTEQTAVIFFSDNGGYGGATSNHPLRGAKGMLYEGGIREPLLIRWPGVTPIGSRCAEPVIGIDLFPTLVEMTAVTQPADLELDGLSLVPLLRDPANTLPRDAIFWHFPCYLQGQGDPAGGPFRTTPAGAIRMGPWKLIEWFETGRQELYHLADDLSESSDLSEIETSQRQRLAARLKQWRTAVEAPVPTEPNPRYVVP